MSLRKVAGRFEKEEKPIGNPGFWESVFHPERITHITVYRFYSGKSYCVSTLSSHDYEFLKELQLDEPQVVMADSESGKTWWMFRDNFYQEDEGLTSTEVKALLLMRQQKRRKQVAKALKYLEADGALQIASTSREPIPDEVKIFVWRRDGGRCVKCESRKNLEFDHIIPLSKGGSNTARNIQLLCEKCNREKGSELV